MNNTKEKITKFINKIKKTTIFLKDNHFKKSIFGIAFILALIISALLSKNENTEIGESKIKNLEKSVIITGTVIAKEESSLSFEKSGKIEDININEGDKVIKGMNLASINAATDYASLMSAEGSYENAKANLNDALNGATDIEIKIKEELAESNKNLLLQANSSSIDTARTIYSGVFDIINNKLSSLFTFNGVSYSLNKYSCNQSLASQIEISRKNIDDKLSNFNNNTKTFYPTLDIESDSLKIDDLSNQATDLTRSAAYLIDDLNNLYSGSCASGDISLNEIRSIISTNKNSLDNIIISLNNTKSQIITYRNNYKNSLLTLEQTKIGASTERIKSLSALLKSSQGSYENAKANYNKNFITAPFDGIITKVNINKGEISSPNTGAINIISDNDYEIKAKLTETDLSKIKVGDKAKITFDALGEIETFDGEISYIEESSTKEGNNNYYYAKVSLSQKDLPIRPGMNSEIKITTEVKENVLSVNNKYIMYKDGKYFVKANTKAKSNNKNNYSDTEIVTGIIGDNGEVEIISGIKENTYLYPIDEKDIAKIEDNQSSPMNNAISERKNKTQSYNK